MERNSYRLMDPNDSLIGPYVAMLMNAAYPDGTNNEGVYLSDGTIYSNRFSLRALISGIKSILGRPPILDESE
ncbi:MAG: hypothetical protein QW727_02615 [Candidatus Pacearchaeota archaeon]